jgi:hypothetical protein
MYNFWMLNQVIRRETARLHKVNIITSLHVKSNLHNLIKLPIFVIKKLSAPPLLLRTAVSLMLVTSIYFWNKCHVFSAYATRTTVYANGSEEQTARREKKSRTRLHIPQTPTFPLWPHHTGSKYEQDAHWRRLLNPAYRNPSHKHSTFPQIPLNKTLHSKCR